MKSSKQVNNKIPFEFLKAVFGYDGKKPERKQERKQGDHVHRISFSGCERAQRNKWGISWRETKVVQF